MRRFMFDGRKWFDSELFRILSPLQFRVYFSVLAICELCKNADNGYLSYDGGRPPRYPYSRDVVANMADCSIETFNSTIKILVDTGRMVIEPNGAMHIVKWDFLHPVVKTDGYALGYNKNMKERIKERDNHTCQRCGIPEGEYLKGVKEKRGLDIHHIDYDKLNMDDSNLITLCVPCHSATRFNREYWGKIFTDKMAKLYGTA